MSVQQVVFYNKTRGFPENANISLCALKDGQWVKLGEGTYDKKNSTITTHLDPETPDGKLLLQEIYRNNLRGMSIVGSHIVNHGENHD